MAFIIIIAMTIYVTFVNGLVFHYFYEWFLLSTFEGLPVINYMTAVGLMLVVSLFKGTGGAFAKKEDDPGTSSINFLVFFLSPWLTLIVGWFIKSI